MASAELGGAADPGLKEALLSADGQGSRMSLSWRLAWTLTLWWAILAIGVALAMLGPTLEELASQLSVPSAVAGTLFTWRASGYLVGAVWCGDLLHRFNNAAVVFSGPLVVACVGTLVLPSVDFYPLACALLLFQGISMGMLDTGGNLLMLDLWRSSPYQNGFEHAYHFFFGLGAAIAPMIVRCLLQFGSSAVLAWHAVGALLAPSCIGLLALGCGPQPRAEEEPSAASGEAGSAAASRAVLLTGAFLFVYVGIEVSFGGYIDLFSVRWLGASKVQGAMLASVYWGALCLGRAVAALVTPFVHHARYLAAQLALAVAATAVLWAASAVPEDAEPGTPHWTLGIVAPTALFGFALAPLFPGAMLVVEELLGGPLPPRDAGKIVGAAAAGEMALPLLVGVLFSANPLSFCWSQLLLCLGSAAVFFINSGMLLSSKGL